MKLLSLSILLALLSLLIASCATSPAPTPTVEATPQAQDRPTSAPALAPSATPEPTAAPHTLTLWTDEQDKALALVESLAADFTDHSATPIRVVAYPPDSLRLAILGRALGSESAPDLIWADEDTLAGLVADGQLEPFGIPGDAGDALPALVTAASLDGKLWAAPITAQDGLLLLYNRRLRDSAPASSDELISAGRADGLVMAWDEPRWLLPWLYAFGGAPVGPDGTTVTLDTPEMLASLNLLRELYSGAPADIERYRAGQRAFGAGDVALAIDGDWALAEYQTLTDTLELGIAPLPPVPGGVRRAAPLLGGSFLMLRKGLSGVDLKQAHAFADFLRGGEIQLRLARELRRLPASQAVLASPVLRDDPLLGPMASLAVTAPGLVPTRAARCALFGIDVWLPSMLNERFEQEEIAQRMQGEAEACVTRDAP